jgi:hypothetical protein
MSIRHESKRPEFSMLTLEPRIYIRDPSPNPRAPTVCRNKGAVQDSTNLGVRNLHFSNA